MVVASLTEQIGALDVTSFGDDVLAELLVETERLLNAAHALSAGALDEFERRGAWRGDGSVSAAHWLAARTGSPVRATRARARAGASLRQLPALAPPARAGRLTPQHLAAAAGCARRHPDLADRDQLLLVEQAEALDADAFVAMTRHWEVRAEAVDAPDPTLEPTPEPVDELHLSRTFDGRYQLNGTFSTETGEVLAAALDGEVDRHLRARRDGDPSVAARTSQVRAAALVDLVAQTMRQEPSDASVPDRYRVAVVVAVDTNELPVAACDSPAFRIVTEAAGEVLDVGRLTRLWPPGIRRAITFRDGGCVFPGCDRPPSWCDIHHCQPWEAEGSTSVANGALLCRRHHTFIHKLDWRIAVEDGRPVTWRSDGKWHVIQRWNASLVGGASPEHDAA